MKPSDIIEIMREYFVSKEVFELRLSPLEKGFYGVISMILLTVVGGLLALVIRK